MKKINPDTWIIIALTIPALIILGFLIHGLLPQVNNGNVSQIPGSPTIQTPYGNRIATLDAYPNPQRTPGKLIDNLDPQATILNPNWSTKSIRPPVSYTNTLKLKQMQEYGDNVSDPNATCMLHSNNPKCYEEDHLCSIEIGGDPKSPLNLWPEPYNINWNGLNVGAKVKDSLENYEAKLIKSGKQTPQGACAELSNDWVANAQRYGLIK